jgi:hypothetical protein
MDRKGSGRASSGDEAPPPPKNGLRVTSSPSSDMSDGAMSMKDDKGRGSGAAPAVRKSGRQVEMPGRLKALNGEDPKLGHAKRRKRKRKDEDNHDM